MRVDFSAASQRYFQRATELAQRQERAFWESHNLLQAILEDEDSRVSELFLQLQYDRVQFLIELQSLSHQGIAEQPILTCAHDFASRYAPDVTITGDLLFLAIISLDATLADWCRSRGIDLDRMRRLILGEPKAPIVLDERIDLTDPVEEISAGRIIDANANRVRESFRILDDYVRLALNDAILTEQIKSLRHDFNRIIDLIPAELLLNARDTPNDVGTMIGVISEYQRDSLEQVARINLKRLQESLRSIEEFSKIVSELVPNQIEQLRYRVYSLEKSLLLGMNVIERLAEANLYLLIGSDQCDSSLEWTVEEAISGGVQVVQLREKGKPDQSILEKAKRLKRICSRLNVLFILNDRPDLARLAEADGVHLGQDDLSIADARRIVGPRMLIGRSTHDLTQLRQAQQEGASYVGIGPTFASKTKSFEVFAGLRFIEEASRLTTLPAFAIGGIDLVNLPEVIQAGAKRVAVSSAIATAENPRLAASIFREKLNRLLK